MKRAHHMLACLLGCALLVGSEAEAQTSLTAKIDAAAKKCLVDFEDGKQKKARYVEAARPVRDQQIECNTLKARTAAARARVDSIKNALKQAGVRDSLIEGVLAGTGLPAGLLLSTEATDLLAKLKSANAALRVAQQAESNCLAALDALKRKTTFPKALAEFQAAVEVLKADQIALQKAEREFAAAQAAQKGRVYSYVTTDTRACHNASLAVTPADLK